MSFDCLIGYIAVDSIARDISDINYIHSRPRNTTLDSLKLAARLLYGMVDYNPMLFQRYMLTGNNHTSGRYQSESAHSYYGLEEALYRRWKEFNPQHLSLIMSDYVLKI